ncbi:MAG: DUF4271 domain-containing protein [Prevotellaceae bacterium]|nr:DUF4271 domain-containing protein [Prevotellaceae bacterium]
MTQHPDSIAPALPPAQPLPAQPAGPDSAVAAAVAASAPAVAPVSPRQQPAAADSAALAPDSTAASAAPTAPSAADSFAARFVVPLAPDSVPLYRTATVRSLGGYAGEHADVSPAADGAAAALGALGLMVTCCVAAGSKRYLGQTLTALRHDSRMRRGALDENSDQRIALSWVLLPVVALAGALLFGQWARTARVELFVQLGPARTALCGALLTLGLLGVRRVLQQFAGYVFFAESARRQWRRLQAPALLLLDFLLLSVWAAGAHFALAAPTLVQLAAAALLTADMLLLARARRIFFDHPGGLLHLFLYFCATEAAPLAVAVRLLQLALGALPAQTFT